MYLPMWSLSSAYFSHYRNNYKVLLYLGYSNLAQNVIFKGAILASAASAVALPVF